MARTLVAVTDIIAGAGHPKFPDTKNRYLKEIWDDWLVEHNDDGTHKNNLMVRPQLRFTTYSGTGAAQTVTFATAFSSVAAVLVWSENDNHLYFCFSGMTTTKSTASAVQLTDAITAISTTGFTLSTNAGVNANGITFYYLALGTAVNSTTGDKSSPPSWVSDGTACLGGDSSAMANVVEANLDTKFLGSHTIDTGAHSSSAFTGVGAIEAGSFTPTDVLTQTETLTDTDLDIKFAWFLPSSVQLPSFKGESLSKLRDYSNTALSSSGYLTLGTGSFVIDPTVKETQFTFFELLSNTTDGSTTFTDTSSFGHTITAQGPAGIQHSTTVAHSGASSIRFNTNDQKLYADLTNGYYGDIDFTCWIYTNVTGQYDNVFATIILTTHFHYASLSLSSDGTVLAYVNSLWDQSSQLTLNKPATSSGIDVNDSVWHKVKLVTSDTGIYLLVDSTLQDSGTFGLSASSSSVLASIEFEKEITGIYIGGGYNNSYDPFRCVISIADYAAGNLAYLDDISLKVTQPHWRRREYDYLVIGT